MLTGNIIDGVILTVDIVLLEHLDCVSLIAELCETSITKGTIVLNYLEFLIKLKSHRLR